MKDKIISILSRYVDDFRFISTTEYKETRSSLQKEDFYDDYTILDNYRTIIVLALSYPSESIKWQKKGTGLLSRYSYGMDYHIVFKERLKQIEEELQLLGMNTFSSVDTGPIDERWAGYVSGLGFLGKNQYLIHKTYGGYIYLATILIDKEIEKEFRVLDSCGTCRICIDACPTNALDNGFERSLCISETTQVILWLPAPCARKRRSRSSFQSNQQAPSKRHQEQTRGRQIRLSSAAPRAIDW